MFYPSLLSDWNHRNAHFLRGVVTELCARGHDVRVFEPRESAAYRGLVAEQGIQAFAGFHAAYPLLGSERYDAATLDVEQAVEGASLVIVHEWSDPGLIRRIGLARRRGRFALLFHDTHHRALSAPQSLEAVDLSDYDGVLAIGDVIREVYLRRGWARRAWTWHEAADTRVFHPIEGCPKKGDLVWIGNWGGWERTAELEEFLLEPSRALSLRSRVYGAGWTEDAVGALASSGVGFGGFVPNYAVPELYARYRFTVSFPRRPFVSALPGVPSIRVFEALACAIPLVDACAWDDADGLFTPGVDFLVARTGEEMRQRLRDLLHDEEMGREYAERGWETILGRHTCAHRVDELLRIAASLGVQHDDPWEAAAL